MEYAAGKNNLSYRWVILGAVAVTIFVTYGQMFSYSVFFKPLADHFNLDRGLVSLVFSLSLIIRGASAFGMGWLADRYGARKILVLCGVLTGAGLALSSYVQAFWQLFLTYALVEALGLSGSFGIGTAMVSRWFTERRGLALGIATAGSGLGTLLIVPTNERLIKAFAWNGAFLITGVAAGVLLIAAALVIKHPPLEDTSLEAQSTAVSAVRGKGLGSAIRDPRLAVFLVALSLFFFCINIIMTHLVNYATDLGIDSLVAATFVSIIGAVSILGRLLSGAGANRMGIHNTLIITVGILALSFVIIRFAGTLWSFYVFTLVFGLPYGAEVPLIPLYLGRFFGSRDLATLVGFCVFTTNIGGAIGPWLAGKLFDMTGNYEWAFFAGGLAGLVSLALVTALKRMDRAVETQTAAGI